MELAFLNGTFFGNTILQYLIFFGYIAGAVILGRIVYYFFKTIARAVTSKTKTDFDDILIDIIEEPLVFLLVVYGFYLGYHQLTLPEKVFSFFNQLDHNLIIIGLAWFGIAFIEKMITHYLAPLTSKTHTDLDDHLVPLIRKLVKTVLILLTILIVISNFGYNVSSVLAGLGIGGLAFALAAQDLLKNFFGGIAILTDKPFKLGDIIEVDKYTGSVVEIGLRSTRLKTGAGDFVTIPNMRIMENSTVNLKKYQNKAISFVLGLTYDTSSEKISKAKKIIEDIVKKNKHTVKDTVVSNFVSFNAYSLDIDVRFEVNTNDGGIIKQIRDSINLEIKKQFDKEKIRLAYPTQTIELKK